MSLKQTKSIKQTTIMEKVVWTLRNGGTLCPRNEFVGSDTCVKCEEFGGRTNYRDLYPSQQHIKCRLL